MGGYLWFQSPVPAPPTGAGKNADTSAQKIKIFKSFLIHLPAAT